jgi:hypothetical protein
MENSEVTVTLRYEDPCPLKPLCPLSPIIKPTNGEYDFADVTLLVPHEAIRVLTERTARALAFYDPERHPWKAKRLQSWLDKAYIPFIQEHHDNEEKIFFPFFHKLGARGFDSQSDEHSQLLLSLRDLRAAAASADGDAARRSFSAMAELLLRHLDAEERFWPAELRKHGPAAAAAAESRVVRAGALRGPPALLMLLLVCEAMGCALSGPHPAAGWASESVKDAFRRKLPRAVRRVLAPAWEGAWRRRLALLLSIAGEQDGAGPSPGCCG